MKAILTTNAAGPTIGCFSAGDVITTEGDDGARGLVSAKVMKALLDSSAAVQVGDDGAPIRPKAEKATKPKSGETATKAD